MKLVDNLDKLLAEQFIPNSIKENNAYDLFIDDKMYESSIVRNINYEDATIQIEHKGSKLVFSYIEHKIGLK